MKRKRNRMNKKGSIEDILWISVTLLTLSFFILIGFKISNEFNTKIQASDIFEEQGKTAMNQINNMYPGVIDKSFLMLAVGLAIVALILAALVRVHPIFLIAFLIALGFLIFFAAIFADIYHEMAASEQFVDVAEQLTMINKIMLSLPFIVGIFGGLLAIIMYKTYQNAM